MEIPEKAKKLFIKLPVIAFATSDKQGVPNIVPIHWKTIIEQDRILLIDNYMKMSKSNLMENSKVCLSFWDPGTDDAYKFKGEAVYYDSGAVFEKGRQFILDQKPEADPKGVVEVRVKDIYTIKPGSRAGEKL